MSLHDLVIPRPEMWAQYHTVGPYGFADSDGETVTRPTAQEASALCRQPNQMLDIAWVDFSLFIGDEKYAVGLNESFIATSRRSVHEVRFTPVSKVIERGRLTRHTTQWLGYLSACDQQNTPDRFEELVSMLPQ